MCIDKPDTPPRLNRRQRRAHLQPAGTPPPPAFQPATQLQPATLAGITEDHAYEQYYFDEPTRSALLRLLARYRAPLLLCTPSLALAAEEAGVGPYVLLDRDERFGRALPPGRFERFDLESPSASSPAAWPAPDLIVCDPPFANVPLSTVAAALRHVARRDAGAASSAPPHVFIAYNAGREAELLAALPELRLERKMALGYLSVKPKTQAAIHLYAPVGIEVGKLK